MKLVLDTNAYCLCDTGHEAALEVVERAHFLYLPVIVYGELYYGFRYGTRLQENIQRLEKFLTDFKVETILVDTDVAKRFGDLFALLRKKGRPIPTNDLWIAASCLAVGGTLLTADQHFQAVDPLEVTFIQE